MMKNTRRKAHTVKLFVAGVPSGIDPYYVLEYFSQFGNFHIMPGCTEQVGESQSITKGHIILSCEDGNLAMNIIGMRNFKFMERTLTVTEHKTGLKLIVQNKRKDRHRVIFKKVPSYLSEVDFKSLLEQTCGPLEALFQYRRITPVDYVPYPPTRPPRFQTYSAVFAEKSTAKMIIRAGFLNLPHGLQVVAEKYLKHQRLKKARQAETIQNPKHFAKKHKDGSSSIKDVLHEKKLEGRVLVEGILWKPNTKSYFSYMTVKAQNFSYNHNEENLRTNYRAPNFRASPVLNTLHNPAPIT